MKRPTREQLDEWRKRSKSLKRRTPMKLRNERRRRARYARNFGGRADAVRAMPCIVAQLTGSTATCRGAIQACHAVARGMGGAKGDRRLLFPGCARHHDEAGERRTSKRAAFEAKHGVDLEAWSTALAKRLDEDGYE